MSDKIKIFAYGSLINIGSLRQTAPDAEDVFPAKVFGFRRSFCLRSSYRFDSQTNDPVCVLNVDFDSNHGSLNGICFEIDSGKFAALEEREKYYDLHEVKVHHYHDPKEVHRGYLFRATGYSPYGFLSRSQEQMHYLQLCLDGCEIYGQNFGREFKETTDFWGIDHQDDIGDIWEGSY